MTRLMVIAFALMLPFGAFGASIDWKNDADGNWNCTGNWVGCVVPNGNTIKARFNNGTSDRTITLDINVTLDTLTFDDDVNYTVSGSNTLSMGGNTNAAEIILLNTGDATIAVDIDNTSAACKNLLLTPAACGTLTLSGDFQGNGETVKIKGAGTVVFSGTGSGTHRFFFDNGTTIFSTACDTWTFGCSDIKVASIASSSATFILENSTTFDSVTGLNVGPAGTGTVIIRGGATLTLVACGKITLGDNNACSNTGYLSIEGCGTTVTATCVWLGRNGATGELSISGGTLTATEIVVGKGNSGSTGTLTISGGTVTVDNLVDGKGANTAVYLNGGVLNLNEFARHGGGPDGCNNSLYFNGTVVTARENNTDFINVNWENRKVQSGGAIFDTAGFNITIDVALTEDASSTGGGLIKRGAGTLTLSNATESTYTGDTRIEAGTIALGDDDVIGNSSDLDMAGGILVTGGFDETFKNLTVNADSTITMSGSSDITFDGGSATFTSGTLEIHNWTGTVDTASAAGDTRIIFNGTSAPTASVKFYSDAGTTSVGLGGIWIDIGGGYYELVATNAVPEASTWWGAGGLLMLIGLHFYRRRKVSG